MLTPTFPDEVLSILCKNAKSHGLPVVYFNSVAPPLSSSGSPNEYFMVLCRASVTEAFYFLRTRDPGCQEELLYTLVKSVVEDLVDDQKASRGLELVSLPMTEEEEHRFEEILQNLPVAQQEGSIRKEKMLDMRRVLQGGAVQYAVG